MTSRREELDGHVARYPRNRGVLIEALYDMGIREMAAPEGASYIYADVAHLTNDSPTFCKRLLEATGVAIMPGVDFDPARGQRTIRFSYSRSPDEVTEAVGASVIGLRGNEREDQRRHGAESVGLAGPPHG